MPVFWSSPIRSADAPKSPRDPTRGRGPEITTAGFLDRGKLSGRISTNISLTRTADSIQLDPGDEPADAGLPMFRPRTARVGAAPARGRDSASKGRRRTVPDL